MSPLSRREFLKTSIAVGTVSVGALPLHATAPHRHRRGHAGQIRHEGDAAGLRHRQQ